MPLADTTIRGAALNWRLAVNGIQNADMSVRLARSWLASSIGGSPVRRRHETSFGAPPLGGFEVRAPLAGRSAQHTGDAGRHPHQSAGDDGLAGPERFQDPGPGRG